MARHLTCSRQISDCKLISFPGRHWHGVLYCYCTRKGRQLVCGRTNQLGQAYNIAEVWFAHEIRTPLSLIIGPLEKLVKTTAQLSDSERKNLRMIDRNAHRLLDLVNQLLDFSKVENRNMVVSEVCYTVGFSNPSYFSKCFYKQFGVSPSEIRK